MTARAAVLCLSSQQFGTDVGVLEGTIPKINWIKLNDLELIAAQSPWMPAKMQQQTVYAYESGPNIEEVWERARDFGVGVLSEYLKDHRILAVMAGNFDYWQDEAIRLGCEQLGIPFLTLLREHFLTADDYEDGLGYQGYKLKPKTDGVAVAGELSRRTLMKFNIVPGDRIRVTGFPRFDLWLRATAPQPLFEEPVVLLSYMKGYGAGQHAMEMLELLAKAADRYPNIPFIVKAKHAFEFRELEPIVRAMGSRLEVILTYDMPALLSNARAIIGYNSLSLYEGLLTPAPVLIPQWGEARRPEKSQAPCPTDPLLRDHMSFLSSPEEFLEALDRAIARRYPVSDLAARRATFSKYVYHTPGEPASLRVLDFIQEFKRR